VKSRAVFIKKILKAIGGEKNEDQKDKEDLQGNLQVSFFLRVKAKVLKT
jgi:hypothetical protein